MKKIKRSLTDIRTLSGRVSKTHQTSRAYMQVTCLEMEKIRLQQELESAMERAEAIRTRLMQIDQEKTQLLRSIDETSGTAAASSARDRPPVVKAGAQAGGGFRIRY